MNTTNFLLYSYAAVMLLFLLPISQFLGNAVAGNSVFPLLLGTIIRAVLFGAFLLFCAVRFGTRLIRLKDFTHKPLFAICLGLAVGLGCYYIRIYLFPFSESADIPRNVIALLFVTLVLASILEEIVFRGVSPRILRYLGYSSFKIMSITSLLFALLHLSNSLIQSFFALLIAALFFTINSYRKNLLTSLSAHLAFNIILLLRYTR